MHSTTTPHSRAKAAPLSPLKRRCLDDLVERGGWKARDLADLLECSVATVRRAEAEHRERGRAEAVKRVAETMGIAFGTPRSPRP